MLGYIFDMDDRFFCHVFSFCQHLLDTSARRLLKFMALIINPHRLTVTHLVHFFANTAN